MLDAAVLGLLTKNGSALTAYEVVRHSHLGGCALTPAQVYRVLARLQARGEVQRIECLGAYTATPERASGFAVCDSCGRLFKLPYSSIGIAVERLALSNNFVPVRYVIEAVGICGQCGDAATAHASAA